MAGRKDEVTEPEGVVIGGESTAAVLEPALDPRLPIEPGDFPDVCPGSTGYVVEQMELLLGRPVTSWYTGEVVDVVRTLQSDHDLEPTGVFTSELALKLEAS
jgi:hypothetical protein